MDNLTIHRGDARTIAVPLTLDGAPWEPPAGSTVRCTAKYRTADPDTDAMFAKSTTDGITVTGSTVEISIAPADTEPISGSAGATLWCDVQVAGPGYGPWTVAEFRLLVKPDVTRTTP